MREKKRPDQKRPLLILSSGATIQYLATDLADTTPGQDLWRYDYTVGGFNFQQNQGFSVFFNHTLYTGLQNPPPPVNADWNVLSVQPDVGLAQPGYYDAQAVNNMPSLSDPFTVNFVWLGQGAPDSQPFTIYDMNFATIASGQTVPVPEPQAFWLGGVGLLLLLSWRKVFCS